MAEAQSDSNRDLDRLLSQLVDSRATVDDIVSLDRLLHDDPQAQCRTLITSIRATYPTTACTLKTNARSVSDSQKRNLNSRTISAVGHIADANLSR